MVSLWQDSDDANLRMYLDVVYNIVSPYKIYDGVSIIEKRNEFHPIRDYLNSLKWDNVSRIRKFNDRLSRSRK